MSKPNEILLSKRAPNLVSVVIPARNSAATIGEQLAALARQNYDGPWEVVVVDNGSSDDTAAVARLWAGRLPGFRVVDASDHIGAAPARNAGVAATTGEFLAFCDADDVVTPGWLTALVAAGVNSDMVSGRLDLERLNTHDNRAWMGWESPTDALPLCLGFLPTAFGGNCGIWRGVLEAVGGWNPAYRSSNDIELSWKVRLAAYRVSPAPDAIVENRLTANLRRLWWREYCHGKTAALLFRDFGALGVPRTSPRRALRRWAGLVRRLPELSGSRAQRGTYVRRAALQSGRLAGSLRFRTLYL